jgi:hypothetical protein
MIQHLTTGYTHKENEVNVSKLKCTPVLILITKLFIIARIWNHPESPSAHA